MAYELRTCIRRPISKGMVLGGDATDGNQFQFVAYKHPDSEFTYFACTVGGTRNLKGEWFHTGLVSAVRRQVLPHKPDFNVSATARCVLTNSFGRYRQGSITV